MITNALPLFMFHSVYILRGLFFAVSSSKVSKRNSTKLCRMFCSKPDLKVDVQNFGTPSP